MISIKLSIHNLQNNISLLIKMRGFEDEMQNPGLKLSKIFYQKVVWFLRLVQEEVTMRLR